MVRSIERRHIAIRVRRESEISRSCPANSRVATAIRILKPETAYICHFPQVRSNRCIAIQHLVQHAALVRFTENKDDVVRPCRLVFMLRSIAVARKFRIWASSCEIRRQKCIEIMDKFICNGIAIAEKLKGFKPSNVQHRSCQSPFSKRKAPIDLKWEIRYTTHTSDKQNQRNHRKYRTRRKHRDSNSLVRLLRNSDLGHRHASLTNGIRHAKCNAPRQNEENKANPQNRSKTIATKRRDCRCIGDIRNMEIGTDKRIRKALVVKAENLVISDCKEKVNDIKYGKRPRTLQERENRRHHEDSAVRHENLPNRLARKHFGHRKP